ncbi:hypothetical protein [Bifidobacterium sp. ESL0790]|uniref:hypothetical protein n=1 Tax=Bifidobacterium sp. ESL0790 TaxID=2983233 RepID=UPI0023F80B94|nr:hypothetical protein [Bifidobacterium sp. ESL0790]WEV72118.1 hypothetical protein OZY47_06675 [Bifidobacterium sp. ESL0790]
MSDCIEIVTGDFTDEYKVRNFGGVVIVLGYNVSPKYIAQAEKYLDDEKSRLESGEGDSGPLHDVVAVDKHPPSHCARVDADVAWDGNPFDVSHHGHCLSVPHRVVKVVKKLFRILLVGKVNLSHLTGHRFESKTVRHDDTSFPSLGLNRDSNSNEGRNPTSPVSRK